jgi:predicted small lipoprotein YifL
MKRLISSLAALVAVACLVSACGQKGPLYLPDEDQDPAAQAQSSQSLPQGAQARRLPIREPHGRF